MKSFLQSISTKPLYVIDKEIPLGQYVPISISAENTDLKTFDVSSSNAWEEYLTKYLQNKQARVAYGGYFETRDIYKRSGHFNASQATERNIHLGIDLWCNVGTKVLSVLEGEIHSFKNNTNFGDYGPTIIIKHHFEEFVFYSLYGHLSVDSIENISVGQKVNRGEIIGALGESKVNGDYAPHLHFQLIIDIEDYFGDYPGVCAQKDVAFYKQNCPDPNLLLKLRS